MNNVERDKRIITVLVIFTIIFTFFGASLAYWNWETTESEKTNIVFTLGGDFSCAVDGGGDITETNAVIVPTTCTNSEHAIMREVTVTPTISKSGLTIDMDLWIKVNSIGTYLSASQNFSYALTTTDTNCTDNVVTKGTFNGTTTNSQITILEKNYNTSTPETYYLWIWLDGAETNSNTMNQTFNLTLGGQCTDDVDYQSEAPTCTLSVTDSGIEFDTYSSDVVSTGLSTSSAETYNDTTSLALSAGTKYGYVKDSDGNTGSCSVEIISTTLSSYDSNLTCNDNRYVNGEDECTTSFGGTVTSNTCSRTSLYEKTTSYCVFEDVIITCEDGTEHILGAEEWIEANNITGGVADYCMEAGMNIGYEVSGGDSYWEVRETEFVTLADCTTETQGTCDEHYAGTTYSSCDSSYIGDYNYSGSITCNIPTYICESGYEKLNDSYCYLNS